MDPRAAQPESQTVYSDDAEAQTPREPAKPVEAAPRISSLLDAVLTSTPEVQDGRSSDVLERFLEADTESTLRMWLEYTRFPSGVSLTSVMNSLSRDIARLDMILNDQVNAIIHHERFQTLEASWRGLKVMVDEIEEGTGVKVRLLDVSWKELAKDFDKAIEFDQSNIFKKIYGEEFGTPGGEPFGLLVGDYAVRHKLGQGHDVNDVEVMSMMSQVAAASFAPFVTGVHPAMFGLDNFSDLERPINFDSLFQNKEYLKWNAFRKKPDSRFVGLVMPQVLMRRPYADDGSRNDGFRFIEDVSGVDRSKYLFGNAAFAFGSVVSRAFAESGWLADIRGVQRGTEGGGLVVGLPSDSFGTDKMGVAAKSSTEVVVTDIQEKELADLGFIPLCHCKDTEFSAFYSNQSTQAPEVFDELAATVNARLSAMLQYILCASRFAHYLKVIARDKIGSFKTPEEVQRFLSNWLLSYTVGGDDLTPETKAKFPLREGSVQVREMPGKPGNYQCVIHLRPHFQLDQVVSSIRLRTELAPSS